MLILYLSLSFLKKKTVKDLKVRHEFFKFLFPLPFFFLATIRIKKNGYF